VRQHDSGADAALGADRAEQPGPGVAAVAHGAGRVPRLAQTRVSVPCWPTRASSANQTSTGVPGATPATAAFTSSAKPP
jgi:hypothetical protein